MMVESVSIWIIKDDLKTQNMLRIVLTQHGFTPKFFETGIVCLEELAEYDPPDLILLDLMLPELNGLEILGRIRQQFTSAELPVILLSAEHDKNAVIEGFRLGANDYLTEPYDHQELLARINSHLSTASLTKQNQQILVKLKELDHLKDQALTVVAHDLKGPVNTFKAGIEMLQDSVRVDPEDEEFYNGILQSLTAATEMMDPLIKEILDLQAIKSRHLHLQKELINLNDIVRNVVNQYQNLSQRKNLEIALNLDTAVPDFCGDPLRLKQIVSNLLNNAIKYSPTGSTIVIRTKYLDSSIRVEVEDNGPGIPVKDVALLFEEFASLSSNSVPNGAGVGLYIARRLVEMHDGQLHVDTQVGVGSTFWFKVPAVQA